MVTSMRLDTSVDPQVTAEGCTAGEVSATRSAKGSRGGYEAIITAAHPSGPLQQHSAQCPTSNKSYYYSQHI